MPATVGRTRTFVCAQLDPIRVYVSGPETLRIRSTQRVVAKIELPSFPGQQFSGKVARTAESIDPATRTLRTEIDVPTAMAALPGSYAQVHFGVNVTNYSMSVPVKHYCSVRKAQRSGCRQ